MPLHILGYCVMPNHWHMVVWPRHGQDQADLASVGVEVWGEFRPARAAVDRPGPRSQSPERPQNDRRKPFNQEDGDRLPVSDGMARAAFNQSSILRHRCR